MSDSPSTPRANRWRRWLFAVVASTSVCALWFAYLNRDGCWLFFIGPQRLLVFVIPWIGLLLFFAFGWKVRIALTVLVLVGLLLWPVDESMPVSVTQSNAVGELRILHAKLEEAKAAGGYPATFPLPQPHGVWARFYQYEYRPIPSTNGKIEHYLIEATPVRWTCGMTRSFTLADNGVIHTTSEQRPATLNDPAIG